MAYLEALGYEWDVFISYATVDNQPLMRDPLGWTCQFHDDLKTALNRRLSGSAAAYYDPEAGRGCDPLPDRLRKAIASSGIFLSLVSPSWLKSDWCQRECEAFFAPELVAGRPPARAFAIECEEVKEALLPRELRALFRPHFWQPLKGQQGTARLRAGSPEYEAAVFSLASQLADRLKELKASIPVYLAAASDDLAREREGVNVFLQLEGFRVLPECDYPTDNPDTFATLARQDIEQAGLFVQLLSGDVPAHVRCQSDLARACGKPIMQWRSRDLNIDREHPAHDLLTAVTVRAEGLAEFKQALTAPPELRGAIVAPAAPLGASAGAAVPPAHPPSDNVPALIFINAQEVDQRHADELAKVLQHHHFEVICATEGQAPGAGLTECDELYRECDAYIILYGDSDERWPLQQYRRFRRVRPEREKPVRAASLVVYPPPKRPLGLYAEPPLITIDATTGQPDLGPFLAQL